jgi:hypothetical protein
MVSERRIAKNFEGSGRGRILRQKFRHSPGGTEETYELEPATSRIQSSIVKHSTTTFRYFCKMPCSVYLCMLVNLIGFCDMAARPR